MTDLISKIIELSKKDELRKIERLIEDKLKEEPNNIGLLLRLAVLEIDPPFADHEKSIFFLQKVLAIDNNNAIAILLLAYVNYYCIAGIDEKLMNKLNSIYTDDNEINSMLKYVASWFYIDKDSKLEEMLLQESINFCESHVYNLVHLAELYFKQGRTQEAKALVEKALSNVKKIYRFDMDDEVYDATDVDEFLNERIKGIYLTESNLKFIKELLRTSF
ncbi:hypothetical protein GF322_00095 [Candidatus Dependentiae bacterium]|nr:hypothetical protein [Candidatus Dependentiae bacterium]